MFNNQIKPISMGLLFATVLVVFVTGCGSPPADTPAKGSVSTAPPMTPPARNPGDLSNKLEDKPAGRAFSIAFHTEPNVPKAGPTKFVAEIMNMGKAANDAVVKVKTTMPDMKMDGPSGELKLEKDGKYSGTLDLPMGGKYRATVDVVIGKVHEIAPFDFEVLQ